MCARLALLLLLAGCAAQHVDAARRSLLGYTLAEAEGVLGIARTQERGDRIIAQWDYADTPVNASLPLADLAMLPLMPAMLATSGSFSLSVAHTCRIVATIQGGRITRVVLAGENGGISGNGAACEPLLRGAING